MAKPRGEMVPIPGSSGISSLDLERIPTSDLRQELARGLTLTADTLARLGAVWAELERRGEDLSDLRHGLARNLPLIAAGRLAAEAVVAFSGRPSILRALEGLPLADQCRLARGDKIAVVDPTDPARIEQLPLGSLPVTAIRLAIHDGEIRTPEAQRMYLRPHRRQRRDTTERRYKPVVDRAAGTVRVGRMEINLQDMLDALSASAGPELSAIIHPEEHIVVKVRLTREEMTRLLEVAQRAELPDWELARKAMRAMGLI